jgi:hypothetical protein
MGALTCDRFGEPLLAPRTGIDWIWHRRESWLADLWGTHEPIAVFFPRDEWSDEPVSVSGDEVDELAGTIRRVPSVTYVGFASTDMISEADAERLRALLPGITVDRGSRTSRAAADSR